MTDKKEKRTYTRVSFAKRQKKAKVMEKKRTLHKLRTEGSKGKEMTNDE